jgi:hypothetical protein
MKLIKKSIFIIVVIAMILLTLMSASTTAYFYEAPSRQMIAASPSVYGPYDRYYMMNQPGLNRFKHDEFNGFDEFVGYKDLDVFYPTGRVDVIRNPNALERPSEWDDDVRVEEGTTTTFGRHVYGMLPGGAIYKKHYDNHESDCDTPCYDNWC